MAAHVTSALTTSLLYGLVSLYTITSDKLVEASAQVIYPYSLGYKGGEFQGDLYAGVSDGTVVAVKGTLFDKIYNQIDLGVEVRPMPHHQKWVNPFYTSKTTIEDKNRTDIPNHLEFVIMGSSKFKIDDFGDILVQKSVENYGVHSVIYFCVVLVQKDDSRIVSNPLSFIVEVISNPDPEDFHKNAVTAGVLVLLIVCLCLVTAVAMSCRRWKFPRVKDNPNLSGSIKDDDDFDTDWKDHYHIKVEDLILEKDKDSDSTSVSSRRPSCLVRPDLCVSTLPWLRLHADQTYDQVNSFGDNSLSVIRGDDVDDCTASQITQITANQDSQSTSSSPICDNGCLSLESNIDPNQRITRNPCFPLNTGSNKSPCNPNTSQNKCCINSRTDTNGDSGELPNVTSRNGCSSPPEETLQNYGCAIRKEPTKAAFDHNYNLHYHYCPSKSILKKTPKDSRRSKSRTHAQINT